MNGDGYGEILAGNPFEGVELESNVGVVRAISGKIMDEEHCADIRWWDSYAKAVNGLTGDARTGEVVADAGDWDGDGLADILIGSSGDATENPPVGGAVYLLFGYEDFFGHPVRLDDLQDVGIEFVTSRRGWHFGELVSAGRDVDGDGISDLLLAEYSLFPDQAEGGARAYLIFGRNRYSFVRGDVNEDGRIDLGDAISILNYLFLPGSPGPWCEDAADVEDDGMVTVGDAIYLLSFLFASGSQPKEPFPEAGLDETGDGLRCGNR